MELHGRRDKILRIRAASLAWQEADREVENWTRDRERMRAFLHGMWHDNHEITTTEDVPRAMGDAWRKAAADVPDRRSLNPAAFGDAADRRHAAQQAIYTPEFVESLARLRLRRPSGVDETLVFLEANPICFHSGYDKQRILRYLRGVSLSPEQQDQLREALLVAVREGAGSEFREHCRTARIVDTPQSRRDLQEIRDHPAASDRARQRAGWMLDAIVRTNGLEPPPARVRRAGPRSR